MSKKWTPPEAAPGAPAPKPEPRVIELLPASAFPPQPLRWLWKPYVPLKKVTICAGPPGQGKSQLALWLAGHVSNGSLIDDVNEPADVVVISAEDDPNDTIVPRLMAVGADFSRVLILSVKDRETDGSLIDAALALPTDGPKLAAALRQRKVRLIVLDPVSAFLDAAVDSYKNASVRRALHPLKMISEETGAAVVSITHLTKGASAGEPLDRVIDSVAFTALARSVLLMAPDPDDEQGTRGSSKILVVAKSNIAPPGEHAQRFALRSTAVPTGDGMAPTSMVEQIGAVPGISAGDLLMPPEDRSALSEAADWLRAELRSGWRPVNEVRKQAETQGHVWRTVTRARALVCERPQKEHGGTGRWWMGLRGTKPEWEGSQLARGLNHGSLGSLPQGDQGDQPQGDQGDLDSAPVRDGSLPQGDQGSQGDQLFAYLNGRGRTPDEQAWMARMLGERDD